MSIETFELGEMFKAWAAELEAQNSLLKEQGEEPLTIEEFVSCRVDDVRGVRAEKRDKHEREWWATYRAALTGMHAYSGSLMEQLNVESAHDCAASAADRAHGPLDNEVPK